MSFIERLSNPTPPDYVVPDFPSLYWPLPIHRTNTFHLYHTKDVWRFTLLWTLIFYGAVHAATSLYAVAVQWRSWKMIWMVPVVYIVVGGVEAVLAGSIIGGLIGAIYNAGYFPMSTWIPFTWGLVNTMLLILSSFAMQGAL